MKTVWLVIECFGQSSRLQCFHETAASGPSRLSECLREQRRDFSVPSVVRGALMLRRSTNVLGVNENDGVVVPVVEILVNARFETLHLEEPSSRKTFASLQRYAAVTQVA